jgi:hypothetical protein
MLARLGFEIVGQVGHLPNVYRVRHSETHAREGKRGEKRGEEWSQLSRGPSTGITSSLLSHPGVQWAEQVWKCVIQ